MVLQSFPSSIVSISVFFGVSWALITYLSSRIVDEIVTNNWINIIVTAGMSGTAVYLLRLAGMSGISPLLWCVVTIIVLGVLKWLFSQSTPRFTVV